MKKLGLLLMPVMAISFLASCGGSTPPVVDVTHTFHFFGRNCTINGETDYSHEIFEKDKNIQYTIVPYAGYELPETVEGVEYNPSNGVITISEMKNDIELRVEATHTPQPGVTHTIHLDPTGGTITGKTILENLPDGDPITTAPIISRDGYDASQVKWYTEPDGGGQEFKFGPTGTDVVTDYFLHAKWGEIAKPIVHYMEEDGISELKQEAVTYGNNAPYYKPTKADYNFVNWYNKKPSETGAAVFDFKTEIKAETYIYAKWESTVGTTYNVKFNIDNCSMTYNGDPVDATTGVNIVVPQGVNPYYVKFVVTVSDSVYMKPSDVTLNGGAYTDYIFNKDKGELVINLQQNTVVTGTCDMYKTLEECSWSQIETISKAGNAPEAFKVGDEKEVNLFDISSDINTRTKQNFTHTVRIIDFNHDKDINGNNLGITFEFKNVITKGTTTPTDAYTTIWDGIPDTSGDNFDYRSSVLNKALNDETSGVDSIINRLPDDLKDVIKPSDKKVGVNESKREGAQYYEAKSFKTGEYPKLFPLAHDEMVDHDDYVVQDEGTKYQYYIDHPNQADRIKTKVGGGGEYYWLRSPCTDFSYYAWNVRGGGYLSSVDVYGGAFAVAPAFCI
ncbi:MAG: DUF6273 domain-containing protein [Bacilli bacterium]|nr:DUF6273 domain-containing protein [Bacilli bacterium]